MLSCQENFILSPNLVQKRVSLFAHPLSLLYVGPTECSVSALKSQEPLKTDCEYSIHPGNFQGGN